MDAQAHELAGQSRRPRWRARIEAIVLVSGRSVVDQQKLALAQAGACCLIHGDDRHGPAQIGRARPRGSFAAA